jgi:hypothetical protein
MKNKILFVCLLLSMVITPDAAFGSWHCAINEIKANTELSTEVLTSITNEAGRPSKIVRCIEQIKRYCISFWTAVANFLYNHIEYLKAVLYFIVIIVFCTGISNISTYKEVARVQSSTTEKRNHRKK